MCLPSCVLCHQRDIGTGSAVIHVAQSICDWEMAALSAAACAVQACLHAIGCTSTVGSAPGKLSWRRLCPGHVYTWKVEQEPLSREKPAAGVGPAGGPETAASVQPLRNQRQVWNQLMTTGQQQAWNKQRDQSLLRVWNLLHPWCQELSSSQLQAWH
jgi:hypothetical protein